MSAFKILGLGTALPNHSISQTGAATFAATAIVPEPTDPEKMPARLFIDAPESSHATAFCWNHLRMVKPPRSDFTALLKIRRIAARVQQNA